MRVKSLLLASVCGLGLLASPAWAQQQQCVANAQAGGTADALTIPNLPCALSTNILILTLAHANATTSPTLRMGGGPALPIYTNALGSLIAGSLPGAGAVVTLTSTGTSWLLLQGAQGAPISLPVNVASGGTGDTSLTLNGLLYGNGTSAVGVTAAGTTGQFLSANTGAAPTWLAGTSTISFGTTGLTPSSATSGAITVAGTLGPANGGTGISTYTIGDLLYASGSTTLSKFAAVASGSLLVSGGVATAPAWSNGQFQITTTVGATRYVTATGSNGGAPVIGTSAGPLVIAPAGTEAFRIDSTSATLLNSTSIPAGGTTGTGFYFGTSSAIGVLFGSGAPTATAPQGSLYLRSNGAAGTTQLYVNTSSSSSWTSLLSGTISGNTSKFVTASGVFTPGNCLSSDASGNSVDNGTPCGTGGSGTVTSSTAGQVAYYPTTNTVVAGNPSLTMSAGALTVGVATSIQGQVKLSGATSGVITMTGQAAAGTYELDWPITAGVAGQALISGGGAGTPMTWASPGLAAISSKTANFNASSNTAYCVDTLTGTATVTATLPASPSNNDIILFVSCSNYSTYNFIIARNGNNVQGLAANMTVATDNASFHLVFVTSYGWRMY